MHSAPETYEGSWVQQDVRYLLKRTGPIRLRLNIHLPSELDATIYVWINEPPIRNKVSRRNGGFPIELSQICIYICSTIVMV